MEGVPDNKFTLFNVGPSGVILNNSGAVSQTQFRVRMSKLFGPPYDESDAHWPVKGYFDRIYDDGCFVEAIEYVAKKIGFSTDGAYCHFPDMDSPFEDEHFDGVEFAYGDRPEVKDTAVISEEIFFNYIRRACGKYVLLHPQDRERISNLLSRFFPSNWDAPTIGARK